MNDNPNPAYTAWQREQDAWMRRESQKLVIGLIKLALGMFVALLIGIQLIVFFATGGVQ